MAPRFGPLAVLDIRGRRFHLPFPEGDVRKIAEYLDFYATIFLTLARMTPGDFVIRNGYDEVFCDKSSCCDPGRVLTGRLMAGYWGEGRFVPSPMRF
ncbi:MAG: hypothetical protein M1471_00195 [Patescibacteria group bacterium]|nr:hypothetical protein [Patescibacteria group bacterium]